MIGNNEMKAQVNWIEEMMFIGRSGLNHLVPIEPTTKNRVGGALSPMEYVLIALGGCTGVDVVSLLKKWKLPLKSLKIEISAERRDEFPRVFSKIKLKYIASGIEEEDLRRAIEESMQKYCSVSAMLGSFAEIEYECQIE